MVCCFSGHRQIPSEHLDCINSLLEKEIIKQIGGGVRIFLAGGALGFDTLAAFAVLKMKQEFENIQFILVLPCRGQERYWSEKDRQIYGDILKQSDGQIYISERYYKGCMHVRNRYLIDQSDHCICYLRYPKGGTAYTVKLAEKAGLEIVNIAKLIR